MATKKEIKSILTELGLTAADMDRFWEEAKSFNKLVECLSRAGKTWQVMNPYCIRSLPTLKEKHLENLRLQKLEEEKLQKEKELALQKQNSLNDEDALIARIKAGDLNAREIRDIVGGDSIAKVVETISGDSGRWSTTMQTVVSLKGEYFMFNWRRGLTENQEDDFSSQPYPVQRQERVITKTIVEWIK